jgi:hypothetical protein
LKGIIFLFEPSLFAFQANDAWFFIKKTRFV